MGEKITPHGAAMRHIFRGQKVKEKSDWVDVLIIWPF